MSDIDVLIERLHSTGMPLDDDAAAALERMRDQENAEWVKANNRAVAAEAEVARLKDALIELLEFSLNPAGMTPEIVADDGKFANFIAENERKCEAAIANARAIYEAYGFAYESRTVNAKGEPYGEWAKAVKAAQAVSSVPEQTIPSPTSTGEAQS
jgi:hypothetical protein